MEEIKDIEIFDGNHWITRKPNEKEIIEKINEIVEWINSKKDQLL